MAKKTPGTAPSNTFDRNMLLNMFKDISARSKFVIIVDGTLSLTIRYCQVDCYCMLESAQTEQDFDKIL